MPAGDVLVINTLGPKVDGAFPVARASEILGGFRSVGDITARDAIPAALREAGMFVRTNNDGVVYVLESDLTTWSVYLPTAPPTVPRYIRYVSFEIGGDDNNGTEEKPFGSLAAALASFPTQEAGDPDFVVVFMDRMTDGIAINIPSTIRRMIWQVRASVRINAVINWALTAETGTVQGRSFMIDAAGGPVRLGKELGRFYLGSITITQDGTAPYVGDFNLTLRGLGQLGGTSFTVASGVTGNATVMDSTLHNFNAPGLDVRGRDSVFSGSIRAISMRKSMGFLGCAFHSDMEIAQAPANATERHAYAFRACNFGEKDPDVGGGAPVFTGVGANSLPMDKASKGSFDANAWTLGGSATVFTVDAA